MWPIVMPGLIFVGYAKSLEIYLPNKNWILQGQEPKNLVTLQEKDNKRLAGYKLTRLGAYEA
jgi:hypothetical protein